ncbi:MAG: hypothetical protein JWN94_3467 [Betaproteobacteria bacterium]|nr:hypothetical protein [Betaproteobacteria bacterium]
MASVMKVRDKSEWMGRDFKNDDSWIVTLTAEQVDELTAAAGRCIDRGLGVTQVKREDFALKTMAPLIESWAQEINHGRGFWLVKGLPAAKLGDEVVRTIFWGIGCNMGSPISQNSYGDMLGEVFDEGVKMGTGRVRGYRTNQRLMFHTDRCDIVGLLCQRTAKSGGLSSIVSSTRIYNDIAANHPDYLAPLENGYIHANMEEGGAFTTYRMPVYSVTGETVSCRILRNTIENARKMGHAKYTELETAALEYMDSLTNDENMRLDMDLEQGDMQFINNYTTLHARTEFEDFAEPEKKRHMVRLWLKAYGRRRAVDREIFKDYDGVEKTLQRKVS